MPAAPPRRGPSFPNPVRRALRCRIGPRPSRRRLRPVLAGLAVLACCGAPAFAVQPSNRDAAAPLPFRVVALGSSSTQGTGASSPAMSYPAQLQRLFEATFHGRPVVTVANRGIAGEDIDDMERRLGADVLTVHPDLVIWQAGSNDPLRGVPMDRFKAELRRGIATMRAGGIEVLLMEPQWSPVIEKADAKSRFVDAVREVGAEQHVEVVRRFALMRGWIEAGIVTADQLIGPDNLHMTDRGYTLLAKAVLDEITTESRAFRDKRALTLSGQP